MENNAKKQYKEVSKAIFWFLVVSMGLQLIFSFLAMRLTGEDDIGFQNILGWIITFVPLYVIAFPITLLIFKRIPNNNEEPKKIKFQKLLVYFVESIAIMYIGNIIGTFLSNVLSNGQAVNPIEELATENSNLKIILVSLIGPIIEEWIFRKQIIDHTIQYGEKQAIIFSALTFGLFHMNLFQFFYAFGVGLMFAYIYSKTRNIKYSIIIHVIINFFGGVIAPMLLSYIDIESIMYFDQLNINEMVSIIIPYLILILYSFLLIILAITGIVLLIINIKKINFKKDELTIPSKEVFTTIYLNPYYIIFFVVCVFMTIFVLY